MKKVMHYMWLRLNQIYSGKRYSQRVWISPQGLFIDRFDGYPMINGIHTNGVHPNSYGYYQLTKSIRALIEGILKEESE